MPDNYLLALVQHSGECREDLDTLALIAAERPFTRIERRAAERALQVLIEACIGLAKFWLKDCGKHLPLDAYESFTKLAELGWVSTVELQQWRKVIGMRNALVHDYLTIDSELLQTVIAARQYHFLLEFIEHVREQLRGD